MLRSLRLLYNEQISILTAAMEGSEKCSAGEEADAEDDREAIHRVAEITDAAYTMLVNTLKNFNMPHAGRNLNDAFKRMEDDEDGEEN